MTRKPFARDGIDPKSQGATEISADLPKTRRRVVQGTRESIAHMPHVDGSDKPVETITNHQLASKGIDDDLALEDVEEEDIVSDPAKRERILKMIDECLEQFDHLRVGGNSLRITQKHGLLAFRAWVALRQKERRMMGYLVYPPGTGKTNLAVLLARMVPGRTVVIAHGNRQNIYEAFFQHEASFAPEDQRSVGQIYGAECEDDSHVVVTHFASGKKWSQIDWSKVDLIIVDEADINGLSRKRAKRLRELADQYSIPIVATTATEEQASGKKLSDVFPDEIDRMGLPEDLPRALKMGIVSPMIFSDLYLDGKMSLLKSDLVKKEYPDELVDGLMQENNWIEQILDDYQQRSGEGCFKKGVIVFRNNLMLDKCLESAKKRGIRAEAYHARMTDIERLAAQERLAKGEIDLLIGSRLLGRGLHVPGIEIVYNSTVTRSPQTFWQADGRGGSPDPNHPQKPVEVVAVLPKSVVERETGQVLPIENRPLSHAAFFDPNYYDQKVNKTPQNVAFDLREISRDIRSVEEVMEYNQGLRGGSYVSRSRLLSRLIDTMGSLNRSKLRWLAKMHTSSIRDLWVSLESISGPLESPEEVQDDIIDIIDDYDDAESNPDLFSDLAEMGHCSLEEEPEFSRADQYWLDLAKDAPMINLKWERRLIEEAKVGNKEAMDTLIKAHLPLVISLAKKFTSPQIELCDLVNEALEAIYKLFEKDMAIRGGMSSHFMIASFDRMQRYVYNHSSDVRVPDSQHLSLKSREWQAEGRLNELRNGSTEKQQLSEHEYLRAIGLSYEEVWLIESMGGLVSSIQALEDHQMVIRSYFTWFAEYKKNRKETIQSASERGLDEKRFLRVVKLQEKSLFPRLRGLIDYIQDIQQDKTVEPAMIAEYPDQLESDMRTFAEVDRNGPLYDAVLASQDNAEFQDDLPDPETPDPDMLDFADKIRLAIHQAMNTLTPRSQEILKLCFGFSSELRPQTEDPDDNEDSDLTLEKIGAIFSLSRNGIRLIRNEALDRLRRTLRPFYLSEE